MDELRHDGQVHTQDHASPDESAISPDQRLTATRATSTINLTSLSALLVVFLDRAQLHGAVPVDPDHIYVQW